MKKLITMVCALAMMVSLCVMPASAAEYNGPTTGYIGLTAPVDTGIPTFGTDLRALMAARDVTDLGDAGESGARLHYELLDANETYRSTYDYKTNSTKINIDIKSSTSASIRIVLYNASTNSEVARFTKTVGSLGYITFSFTGLSHSNTYYFKTTNLGEKAVELTGSIYA